MFSEKFNQTAERSSLSAERTGERGAALVTALVIMALMMTISASVLTVVTTEANITGSDLKRTQAFYATQASIEQMTNGFSSLFSLTARPTTAALQEIADTFPAELISEGFTFQQTLVKDEARLTKMRSDMGLAIDATPTTNITTGPFAGLFGSITPYKLASTATNSQGYAEVTLEREINNFLIPLFQFGMFTDGDMEIHPGPAFYFNGRVHANGNFYISGPETGTNFVNFLGKVTIGREAVYNVMRNGQPRTGNVKVWVGATGVTLNQGSFTDGPHKSGSTATSPNYFPDSPTGTKTTAINWETQTVQAPSGATPTNKFNRQLLTRTTGAVPLLLPFQLDGAPTREIIKRAITTDTQSLSESRYHNKAQIRILIDDAPSLATGWPSLTAGVNLAAFVPTRLGANVLRRHDDSGNVVGVTVKQGTGSVNANAVRGGLLGDATAPAIPTGAPLTGRILIQLVQENGTAVDVTQRILSMGITEGEPNGIVYLQRPMWAAFMQGSRDRDTLGGPYNLASLTDTTNYVADGEVSTTTPPTIHSTKGYLNTGIDDDTSGLERRGDAPPAITDPSNWWNSIVPINVYNVREGLIHSRLNSNQIYERGITSVVEINMKNLARWVGGVYDSTLLAGSAPDARASNIKRGDGYILYVSDRRGDSVPVGGTTNGIVDNEDIYIFPSTSTTGSSADASTGTLDPGEDVNGDGLLSSNILELPYPFPYITTDVNVITDFTPTFTPTVAAPWTWGVATAERLNRAKKVLSHNVRYFRRAVRLFNGERIQAGAATATSNLSINRGISVTTENMVYIWGNFNTTGITCQPANGSTLNQLTATNPTTTLMPCRYKGDQVPSSIVSDAFFPLSKTWADSLSAMYPQGGRPADDMLPADPGAPLPNYETAVRAGIIAGNNKSAIKVGYSMTGNTSLDAGNGTESRLNGGMHNYPRFLEGWSQRWNLVGALIPLYNSTQAVGPYRAVGEIYGAPIRNWSFDDTFKDPNRLPPGTPQFQYIEPTGFRQKLQQ
ncbi:MAG: pilus assembly PilX N-terminal domain-containing protein [Pyrinomonadaceae bacterium]|nr:pilus assembly PilX N-terminal domain-containing protein [Pyrinomonadaceae bacterium]